MTVRRPEAARRLTRYSLWDLVPVFLIGAHISLLATLYWVWSDLSWAERILGAMLYGLAIGWSLDSIAHNFIHNPFFKWRPLNRLVAYCLTLANGVPQTMYAYVHMRHHAGNSDRKGADGKTVDPISLYQYGADGNPEDVLPYVFLQFWRDDGPFTVAAQIRAKRPEQAREAMHEFWVMIAVYGVLLVSNWQFVVVLAPFYYLGQCFTALIAYYEHFGADPDVPAAWGVSTYAPMYNWMFLNNGYHAEHHFRPKWHWTQMQALRAEMAGDPTLAKPRTLRCAHPFGFLDPVSRQAQATRTGRAGEAVG